MREGNGQPPSSVDDNDADADIGSLRERLRVFESFDEVISESMRRARGFLQEAADMRERVMRELADARRELEEELAEARAELQEEIAEARAEIEEERNQLVSIAQSILNRSGGASGPATEPSDREAERAGITTAPPAPESPAEPEPVSPYPFEQPPAFEAEQEAALIPAPVDSDTPLSTEPHAAEPELAPVPPPIDAEEPVRTTIIVHGIHRPAVATGLQRYLLAQPGVTAVEPREFAEGILRLQVHATARIDDALFAGWSDGAGMTVIQRVPRTVEVILPSAT